MDARYRVQIRRMVDQHVVSDGNVVTATIGFEFVRYSTQSTPRTLESYTGEPLVRVITAITEYRWPAGSTVVNIRKPLLEVCLFKTGVEAVIHGTKVLCKYLNIPSTVGVEVISRRSTEFDFKAALANLEHVTPRHCIDVFDDGACVGALNMNIPIFKTINNAIIELSAMCVLSSIGNTL